MNQWEFMDKEYIWHPFTQMKGWNENKQLVIAHGEGVKLYDRDKQLHWGLNLIIMMLKETLIMTVFPVYGLIYMDIAVGKLMKL